MHFLVSGIPSSGKSTFCGWLYTPMPANAETLPEIHTAKELEAFQRIDAKTINSYMQRGLIPHMRIESTVRFPKHQALP
jgi:hypothetical protein